MDSKWTCISDHSWQQQLGMSCRFLHFGTVLAVLVHFAWPHQWLQICTAEKQPLVRGRQEWWQQKQSVKYEALSKLCNFNLTQSVFLFPTVPSLKFPTAWTVKYRCSWMLLSWQGQVDPWEASEPILPHILCTQAHMQCEIKFSPTISYRPNACRLLLITAISTTRSKILIMEHASKEIHAVPLPKLDICMSARPAGVPPAAKKVCAVSLIYTWLQFTATVGMSHSLLHFNTVAAVPMPFAWPHQWLQICQPLLVGRQECDCVVLSLPDPDSNVWVTAPQI